MDKNSIAEYAHLHRLNFSYNWNNKLNCNVFSTIRRYNPAVHYEGRIVQVFETGTKPGTDRGKAKYIIVTPFKLHQLKPSMAYLDTGYNLEETKNILRTMYTGKVPDIEQETFCYCILEKIKEKPQQQSLF